MMFLLETPVMLFSYHGLANFANLLLVSRLEMGLKAVRTTYNLHHIDLTAFPGSKDGHKLGFVVPSQGKYRWLETERNPIIETEY